MCYNPLHQRPETLPEHRWMHTRHHGHWPNSALPNKPFSQNTNIFSWEASKTFQNQFLTTAQMFGASTSPPYGTVLDHGEVQQRRHGLAMPDHAVSCVPCSTDRELASLEPLAAPPGQRRFRVPLSSFLRVRCTEFHLPRAPPALALIVNSHMINLSAWEVARIEAPESFPLG